MKQPKLLSVATMSGLLALSMLSAVQAATVNVGAVANSASTGQYLSVTGTAVTAGLIKVGFFSGKSFADIAAVINGWTASTTALQAYDSINSLFTQIGTVINPSSTGGTVGGSATGLYATAGTGWNFSSAGNVSGTANYVDLALVPQSTQIYVWAFNNTDFTFAGADAPTQWALVTDRNATGGTWTIPGSGALSMVANSVSAQSDILLGTDNGNNVNMVAVIPEPSILHLMAVAMTTVSVMCRKRKNV